VVEPCTTSISARASARPARTASEMMAVTMRQQTVPDIAAKMPSSIAQPDDAQPSRICAYPPRREAGPGPAKPRAPCSIFAPKAPVFETNPRQGLHRVNDPQIAAQKARDG